MIAQFIVKVLDPAYAARDATLVRGFWAPEANAGYSRNDFIPLTRLATGVFRFGPVTWDDVGTFYFWVEEKGYQSVFDYLIHKKGQPLSSWEFGTGRPEFYVRNRDVTSSPGEGVNLEVFIVLSRLTDARTEVNVVQANG